MKRTIAVILSFMLALSLCAVAVSAGYSDVAGHWSESAVDEWSDYNIVQGSGGKFRPNDPMTRAELATVIARLLKLTEKAQNTFSDVPAGAWYEDAVLKCAAAGIVTGYTDGTFRPNQNVKRGEATVMLARALGIDPDLKVDLSAYKDGSDLPSWASGYVKAMVREGIILGVSDTELAINNNINRASVVTILSRAIDEYVTEPCTLILSDENRGITIVACPGVTLAGKTGGSVLVAQGAGNGKTVIKAETRDILVRASNAEIELSGASIGWITFEGEDCYLNADEKSVMNAVVGDYTDGPAPDLPEQSGSIGTGTDAGTGTGSGTGSGSGSGTGLTDNDGTGGWTPFV